MANDRRVNRTENALKRAMTDLLTEKPITKVTIKELCERADINRGTFYAHYADQYALLNAIISEVVDSINMFVDSSAQEGNVGAYYTVKKVFEFVRAKPELCRVLLSENTKLELSDLVIDFMVKRNIFRLDKYNIEKSRLNKYICSYIANGSLGIFNNWLEGGMIERDETMAKILINLVSTGMREFSKPLK